MTFVCMGVREHSKGPNNISGRYIVYNNTFVFGPFVTGSKPKLKLCYREKTLKNARLNGNGDNVKNNVNS